MKMKSFTFFTLLTSVILTFNSNAHSQAYQKLMSEDGLCSRSRGEFSVDAANAACPGLDDQCVCVTLHQYRQNICYGPNAGCSPGSPACNVMSYFLELCTEGGVEI